MSLFHLSHTDLDGYGAQIVSEFYFQNIHFFNSNYGKEIEEKIKIILNLASCDDIILITDLNLLPNQAIEIENLCRQNGVKLLLLDHHQSGAECEKKHIWYYLDNSKCATKITYEFFSEIYGENPELAKFVEIVDAIDIWQSEKSEFEFGKICMEVVSSAKELNKVMFDAQSRDYIFYLIKKAMEFDDNIALDAALHSIKKAYFRDEKDNTLTNLVSDYVVALLGKNRSLYEIKFADKLGVLTYNIGSVSVIGNQFLLQNPDIDFFIDVTSRKTVSFRANGNADVSQMAKILFGGGGHINASGGFWTNFKDSFDYTEIKRQMVNLIEAKTANLGDLNGTTR